MPGGFLPEEDQGYVITVVQAQPGSTTQRTSEVVGRLEKFYAGEPQTEGVVAILGFSFFGRGQTAGLLFTSLTDWDERPGEGSDARRVGKECDSPGSSRWLPYH